MRLPLRTLILACALAALVAAFVAATRAASFFVILSLSAMSCFCFVSSSPMS